MEHLDYFFPDISTPRSREVLLEDPTPYYKRWGEIMLSHIHPELKSPLDIFEYIHVGPSGEKARRGVHLPGLWHHIFFMPRTKSSCYVKAPTASSSSQQRQQQQSTAASGQGSAAVQALLQPAV